MTKQEQINASITSNVFEGLKLTQNTKKIIEQYINQEITLQELVKLAQTKAYV